MVLLLKGVEDEVRVPSVHFNFPYQMYNSPFFWAQGHSGKPLLLFSASPWLSASHTFELCSPSLCPAAFSVPAQPLLWLQTLPHLGWSSPRASNSTPGFSSTASTWTPTHFTLTSAETSINFNFSSISDSKKNSKIFAIFALFLNYFCTPFLKSHLWGCWGSGVPFLALLVPSAATEIPQELLLCSHPTSVPCFLFVSDTIWLWSEWILCEFCVNFREIPVCCVCVPEQSPAPGNNWREFLCSWCMEPQFFLLQGLWSSLGSAFLLQPPYAVLIKL